MPTRYSGTETETRALDAYIKLMRAANTVSSRLHSGLTEAGLTTSQFGTLEALYHLGPMCQKELGEKLLVSGGNITMVVNNLEKRNLVQRVRTEEDRRFVQVSLTPKGRALIADLFPRHVKRIVKEMGALSLEQQGELARLCKTLGLGQR